MTNWKTKLLRSIWPDRPLPSRTRIIAQNRLVLAGIVAGLCFVGISAKAVHLATNLDNKNSVRANYKQVQQRGPILDRRGRLMAQTVPIMVLHADPKKVMDQHEVAEKLAPLLGKKSQQDILNALSRKGRYIELARKITPQRHADILALGLPGIYISPSETRLYPQGAEAAHLLGTMDIDGKGIAGIEKQFDERLRAGNPVALSIDLGVQAVVRRELQHQIEQFDALGGAGLVLDVRTGEILSLTSLPDYNANQYSSADADAQFNRATKGVFEMGSIFKVLNSAIALETGVASLGSSYDVSKPLRVARFRIRDYHPHNRPLNLSEILVYSSNIGSARIAEDIGAAAQKAFMDRLGLLKRPALELPEISKPLIPRQWERIASMTISYGHGLSVSPVQAAGAIAAASGHGFYIEPTLLRRAPTDTFEKSRIFSEDTVRKVRSMMRLAVSHEDGTVNFANAPGYMVGGKTGTAEKVTDKGYNRKANLVSVVASFPIHDPAYLIFIMVDEPKPQKHSYGYATAGWVAAPAIARIVTQIAPMMGIHPVDKDSPEIRQNLEPNIVIGTEGAIRASY